MVLSSFTLSDVDLPANLAALRAEVRDFLAAERESGGYERTPSGWDRYEPGFSRRIGARGWIGMTWPKRYGGKELSSLERYVVTEELLTAGAPVRAHWLADRQIGPLLLNYGSEEQRQLFLPRVAKGECYVCAGMSEPDSGSDLASIRTKGTKVSGGWVIDGLKVWTSYAHMAHYINLFARTAPRTDEDRHRGVTQFLIDLTSKGVTIRPIINIAGDHDFNEVHFDGVFVPDKNVVGTVGGAWSQVSTELAHERSGSERWVNAYGVIVGLIDLLKTAAATSEAEEKTGRLVAHLWTLHRMSFSIAAMIEGGATPAVEAALVKDLGTIFDQEIPAVAREVLSESVRAELPGKFNAVMDRALLYAPACTIRGGTKEILRGIIARGLGLR